MLKVSLNIGRNLIKDSMKSKEGIFTRSYIEVIISHNSYTLAEAIEKLNGKPMAFVTKTQLESWQDVF